MQRSIVYGKNDRIVLMAEKAGRKNSSRFWLAFAKELGRPRRIRAIVNLGKISKLTKSGETIIIAGKLLGYGRMAHPVKISCVYASPSAMRKLVAAGGEYIPIDRMIQDNPKGTKLRLIR